MTYKRYVRELHEKIEQGLEVIQDMESILDQQASEIAMLQDRIMALEPCDKTALELLGEETVFTAELRRDTMPPPEKVPVIAASRKRIKKAEKMFNDHFDPSGNPKTIKGEKLSAKYGY